MMLRFMNISYKFQTVASQGGEGRGRGSSCIFKQFYTVKNKITEKKSLTYSENYDFPRFLPP